MGASFSHNLDRVYTCILFVLFKLWNLNLVQLNLPNSPKIVSG